MSSPPVRLLLLEDSEGDAGLLQATLATYAPGEFVLTRVERLADALVRIKNEPFDVVLSDLGLPDSLGLDTFYRTRAAASQAAIIVLTATDDEDRAIHSAAPGSVATALGLT